jgi:hypothetical protein
MVEWPRESDDDDEEDDEEDEEDAEDDEEDVGVEKDSEKITEKEGTKDGENEEEHPRVVTDKGFPITQDGMDIFIEIYNEIEKRDQDSHNMYIYNDWTGYGVTEVMENMVRASNSYSYCMGLC